MITKQELIITIYTQAFYAFSTFRIDESSVMSALGDGLFKYG